MNPFLSFLSFLRLSLRDLGSLTLENDACFNRPYGVSGMDDGGRGCRFGLVFMHKPLMGSGKNGC